MKIDRKQTAVKHQKKKGHVTDTGSGSSADRLVSEQPD